MALVDRYPIVRWGVPVAAAATVFAAVAAPQAFADPALPERSAQQLLVDLQNPTDTSFSGTVETRTDLGLPALPVGANDGYAALLNGTNTLRVWQDGKERSKVSLIASGAETTTVRNGAEVWQWSSKDKKAVHATHQPRPQRETPAEAPKTPDEAAQRVLAQLDPSTEVSVGRTSRVAGRSAYELVLDPKSQQTLVGKVTIAVDSQTHNPLRVEVWPSGKAAPAIRVGFTQIDFADPAASTFRFSPPAGAEVVEKSAADKKDEPKGERPARPQPKSVGEGWERVTVTAMPKLPANTDPSVQRRAQHSGKAADWQQLVQSLPTVSGSWGSGKVLNTALVTVVVTEDGRVAAGSVPTDRVVAALAG
ncbi:hypothetical protein HJ590_06040 [Naumannella sp. ID2617S]|nr:hypothetical protein [Naumannella sp. ID2617S]